MESTMWPTSHVALWPTSHVALAGPGGLIPLMAQEMGGCVKELGRTP